MNQHFVIYDATGAIIRTGECPPDDIQRQAAAGETLLLGVADCAKDAVDVVAGKVLPGGRVLPTPKPTGKPTGSKMPSAEQMLDMLWQAMDAGAYPKAEPFYSAVKAAKAAG